MATRMVKEEFWTDTYIEDLEVDEKLLFLYLITNPLCNVGGAYQIKTKRISYETGIPKDRVLEILEKFNDDDRIVLIEDWIFILNFSKHQANNPNIHKGIERVYQNIPENIKGSKGFQRVSKRLGNYTLPYLTDTLLRPYLTDTQHNAPRDSVSDEQVFNILRKFKKLSPHLTGREKSQVEACGNLWREYGEEVMAITDQAIAIQGKQYAPKILSPVDLWEKIGDLQVFLKRNQENNNLNKVARI